MQEDPLQSVPFIDENVVASYPEEARTILRQLYLHERNARQRVLASPPASATRAQIMSDMYDGTWRYCGQLDNIMQRAEYQSGVQDRSSDAAAVARLTTPSRAFEIGAGGGSLCRALAAAGWQVEGLDLVVGADWAGITEEFGVGYTRASSPRSRPSRMRSVSSSPTTRSSICPREITSSPCPKRIAC